MLFPKSEISDIFTSLPPLNFPVFESASAHFSNTSASSPQDAAFEKRVCAKFRASLMREVITIAEFFLWIFKTIICSFRTVF